MSEIDINKLVSELRKHGYSLSCQILDGSNRGYDLTAARVIRAIASSIEYAQKDES